MIGFGFGCFSENRVTLGSRANLIVLTIEVSLAILVGGGDGVLGCTLTPIAVWGGDERKELLDGRSLSRREKTEDELLVTFSLADGK